MFGGQFPDRDARLFGVRGASLFQELDAADRLRRRGARDDDLRQRAARLRSEEHTSELQSLMRVSYAVSCLKKKKCKNIVIVNANIKMHFLLLILVQHNTR